ncbi:MAG: tRNA uridine-5-carboxymethylaminomethyl(34) synthesis GTPase MnmE [Micavibrio sp.]
MTTAMTTETIFALSSAPGKAGVAVVRVSGPKAHESFKAVARRDDILPRKAVFTPLYDAEGAVIDEALVLAFQGPHSFTGEDVIEYQIHGSPAVLDALFARLGSCGGHRMAEPGEFTRRAFENGKLDLTEAEAVADLINAQTQMQRLQALGQMGGALSKLYEDWRTRLIKSMAYIEAVIDFPDEDIPDSEVMTVLPALQALTQEIESHLNDGHRGERLRDGIRIAILGAPNAGKSSLLNALARRDAAIVSPMAGTTRDVIEVHLDLGGYPVILADTAGLRPEELSEAGGHDSVEAEGIKRALARAREADIKLVVFDGMEPAPNPHSLSLLDEKAIAIFTKQDAPGNVIPALRSAITHADCAALSSQNGAGMDSLLALLTRRIAGSFAAKGDAPSLTRARHRAALEECLERLRAAITALRPELMAEDIRMAARALGRITGRIDVEDLLDVIFRDFCIGK